MAERRFYRLMTLAIFAAVYVGFAPSFFLRPWFPEAAERAPPEAFFYFHGAVFTAWFLLLVLQPALVALGRVDLHRVAGGFGAAVAAMVVVTGAVGAGIAARRPGGFIDVPVPPLQFLAIPLFDLALFAAFVFTAIARRHDAQSHKRLMLVASVCLIGAAIARWPLVMSTGGPLLFFALADLFLLPLVAWDLRTRGGLHPATLWAGLALIASQPLRLWVSGTPAWLWLAERIT